MTGWRVFPRMNEGRSRGAAHGPPPAPYCLLPTAYCLLPIASSLLPIAYCLPCESKRLGPPPVRGDDDDGYRDPLGEHGPQGRAPLGD
jgi:hypothetical protein